MGKVRPDVLLQVDRLFGAGTVGGLTDAQLLNRFASRKDEAAFGALVERHGPLVLRVCRNILGDSHAAEDAFQATFLVLARKARSLWVNDDLSGWLYEVARRVSIRSKSDTARRRRYEQQAATEGAKEVHPDIVWSDAEAVLHEEVSRLPETFRSPLILCYFQGMSYETAARHLRVSESTVRGRLARARQHLRPRLIRRGVGLPVGLMAAESLSSTAPAAVAHARVHATAKAASHIVAGRVIPGGAIKSSVAVLTEGVLKTMLLTKLKMASAALLAVCGLAAVTGQFDVRVVSASDPTIVHDQAKAPDAGGHRAAAALAHASPTPDKEEGTVLFIHNDKVLRAVSVFYPRGELGIWVLVPSAWNVGLGCRAYQVTSTGLRVCDRERIERGTLIKLEDRFTGTATIILAEDERTVNAIRAQRWRNRQEAAPRLRSLPPQSGKVPVQNKPRLDLGDQVDQMRK